MNKHKRTLILGYGNPGRQDDGLGEAFIQRLSIHPVDATLESDYQLSVETAYDLQHFDQIIFVDASYQSEPPFQFTKLYASEKHPLGSHSVSPEALLQLCKTLYKHEPVAYLLAIRGHEFDRFEEQLSTQANHNCEQAIKFILHWLSTHMIHNENQQHA